MLLNFVFFFRIGLVDFKLILHFVDFVLVSRVDLFEFAHVRMVLDFFIASLYNDLSLVEENNSINVLQEVNCVRDQNSGFVAQETFKYVGKYLFLYVGVKS